MIAKSGWNCFKFKTVLPGTMMRKFFCTFGYSKGVYKLNILFFLTPKSEVAYIHDDDTIRQAMEKMEYHRYSCVPIINEQGEYRGCITEGDLLWGVKDLLMDNIKESEKVSIMKIKRHYDYKPVHVETDMDHLINRAMNQNFVPVVDDQDKFIGIITRKDIMQYFYQKMNEYKQRSGISLQTEVKDMCVVGQK